MHPVLEVVWGVAQEVDACVGCGCCVFECASVCCCGSGVVSVISVVQVLVSGEC